MKNKLMITGWVLYILSIIFIFGSHIWMLGHGLLPEEINPHAVLNIIASVLNVVGLVLILVGWRK